MSKRKTTQMTAVAFNTLTLQDVETIVKLGFTHIDIEDAWLLPIAVSELLKNKQAAAEKLNETVIKNLRFRKDLYEALAKLAADENRSVNNMVETILIRTLEQLGHKINP